MKLLHTWFCTLQFQRKSFMLHWLSACPTNLSHFPRMNLPLRFSVNWLRPKRRMWYGLSAKGQNWWRRRPAEMMLATSRTAWISPPATQKSFQTVWSRFQLYWCSPSAAVSVYPTPSDAASPRRSEREARVVQKPRAFFLFTCLRCTSPTEEKKT